MLLLKSISTSVGFVRGHRNLSKFANSNLKATLLNMNTERQSSIKKSNVKAKNVRYAPGTVTLQVLGSGSTGCPAVLYLFTDQSRYMFNCGEGTQRLAHEYKMKLSRLEHIFFTRRTWDKMGGLPGLSLTIQDAGVSLLSLHGPSGIDELFTAAKRFVVLRDLEINTVESRKDNYFEDTVMTVHYIPLERKCISSSSDRIQISKDTLLNNDTCENTFNQEEGSMADDTDYYAHERSGTRTEPVRMTHLLNLSERSETEVMAYVCRLKPKPGTLDLERCVELGVKPGPVFGQLKNGIDVILPNGNTVRSSDVRTPDDPGPLFVILDIPTEEYLDSLEENKEFEKYQSTASNDTDLAILVVHFTPPDIMKHPRYQSFMKKFSLSTMHIKVNEGNQSSGSMAVHRLQHQLHQLDDQVFPLLQDTGSEDAEASCGAIRKNNFNSPKSDTKRCKFDSEINTNEKEEPMQSFESELICERANTLTCFHLRPKKGLDRTSEPLITPSVYIAETNAVEGFHTSLQDLKSKLRASHKEYPRIIFLGTGSCIPNKTRNTSAILIQLSASHNMLLDCGEGTFGQFVRHFGKEGTKNVMKNLKTVYISHLHADHHIGLIGLLEGRQKYLGDEHTPVTLLAPRQISSWLDFYNKRFEKITDNYKLIPNQILVDGSNESLNLSPLGISNIQTCYVRHCPHAFGIAVHTMDGKKITYSGDTMPSQELVAIGLNSDILVHEATMEDDLEAEAEYKMHSTISQAISVGTDMKAKNILLTHFSQRYAKIPRIQDINTIGNVGLAFDHMEIGIEDFSKLPVMYDCLKVMFSEHCEELEERAVKRMYRKQLKAMKMKQT